jgi:hypothetical protein
MKTSTPWQTIEADQTLDRQHPETKRTISDSQTDRQTENEGRTCNKTLRLGFVKPPNQSQTPPTSSH